MTNCGLQREIVDYTTDHMTQQVREQWAVVDCGLQNPQFGVHNFVDYKGHKSKCSSSAGSVFGQNTTDEIQNGIETRLGKTNHLDNT